MTNRRVAEEILSTAALAVSEMSFCEVKDRYLAVNGTLNPVLERAALPQDLDVRRLNGRDSLLSCTTGGWRYALFTADDGGQLIGCLVLSAASPPNLTQLMQVRTVTKAVDRSNQCLGKLPPDVNGRAPHRDATDQRLLSLSVRVLELEEHERIRNELDRVGTPDVQGSDFREELLAEVLSRLTARPICIEDGFGHIRAAIGIGPKCPYPRLGAAARWRTAQLWLAAGSPVREPGRLVAPVLSHGEVLGAICMLDTDRPVTAGNIFALKYATRLLEKELSHRRSLAQLEVKLGRDLVDELLSGMDAPTAVLRTEALGYDISGPQHVIVAEWQPQRTDDTVVVALRKTFLELRSPALISQRANMAIAVVRGNPLGVEVFTVLSKTLRNPHGAVGVGGPCLDVAQIPRSFSEAVHACRIRAGSSDCYGGTRFDQLGIYRILDTAGGEPELAAIPFT